jgi:hypothetical protein
MRLDKMVSPAMQKAGANIQNIRQREKTAAKNCFKYDKQDKETQNYLQFSRLIKGITVT